MHRQFLKQAIVLFSFLLLLTCCGKQSCFSGLTPSGNSCEGYTGSGQATQIAQSGCRTVCTDGTTPRTGANNQLVCTNGLTPVTTCSSGVSQDSGTATRPSFASPW